MAPEMVTSHQYTEKVDVFSIGVMLFEALRGRLNVTKLAVTHDPGSLQDYADSVADGFREDVPSNWPEEVASLIRDSWHQVRTLICTRCGGLRGESGAAGNSTCGPRFRKYCTHAGFV